MSVPRHDFVGYSLYCSLLADSCFEAFLWIVTSCAFDASAAFGDVVEETADKKYSMDLFHQMNKNRVEMLICSAAAKAAAGSSCCGPP